MSASQGSKNTNTEPWGGFDDNIIQVIHLNSSLPSNITNEKHTICLLNEAFVQPGLTVVAVLSSFLLYLAY